MTLSASGSQVPPVRAPAVAGTFYPGSPRELRRVVDGLFAAASALPRHDEDMPSVDGVPPLPLGLLVPHAGLVYSGTQAAAAWARIWTGKAGAGMTPPKVVLLGTNHRASWLDGVGIWPGGAWSTPVGHVLVDSLLAAEILDLGGPFVESEDAHGGEHSIEVQLPLLVTVAPAARIVPLAVSAGIGDVAIEAGRRLGRLLAGRREAGDPVVLVISSDMAHYPDRTACEQATDAQVPAIRAVDAAWLARAEGNVRRAGARGLVCGMCGIEPAVLGLAALREMGAAGGTVLAASTSADAGGPPDRTVGYLAVRFDAAPAS